MTGLIHNDDPEDPEDQKTQKTQKTSKTGRPRRPRRPEDPEDPEDPEYLEDSTNTALEIQSGFPIDCNVGLSMISEIHRYIYTSDYHNVPVCQHGSFPTIRKVTCKY